MQYFAHPPTWALLIAILALMGGLVLYVMRLNLNLRYSKRVLEVEIGERRRAEEKLAENENRLRQIIASEPECVKLQTLDGILLEMNPAGLCLVEAGQPNEIIGTSVYNIIAPEFRDGYRALSARVFGIDLVLADVLPGQKADKVKELQAQGKKVGMVGDGINDAPALTQADVGFAIGAGTDVAMESADVVLMKSDPFDVVGAIVLSRATLTKMHQNLWWAVAYNVVAFPVAAGVFYPFVISPEVAALAMSGSSALVAVNALLLKRTRLEGIRAHGPTQGATI